MATFFRYDTFVKTAQGPALAGVQVYVCTQPANVVSAPPSPLAAIYSDPLGLFPITQPIQTDGFGHADFYTLAGQYTVVIAIGSVIQNVYQDQNIGNGTGLNGVTITNSPTAGQVLVATSSTTAAWETVAGTGTVTAFSAGSLDSIATTTVTNPNTTPTLNFTLSAQQANTTFVGPASGASTTPTFRHLVFADLPYPLQNQQGGIIQVQTNGVVSVFTTDGLGNLIGNFFFANTTLAVPDLVVNGTFTDSTGHAGTAGQILSSTVTGTLWVASSAGATVPVGPSEMVGVSAAGGTLAALPGSILDYVNGTLSIAPTGAGATTAALNVTGDSVGNPIQQWFAYGSGGNSGLVLYTYGDSVGVEMGFYDAAAQSTTTIHPGFFTTQIGVAQPNGIASGINVISENLETSGGAGLPFPTKGITVNVLASGEPNGYNTTGIEVLSGGHANNTVFGIYSRVYPWEDVGPTAGYSVFIDTPPQYTGGFGGGSAINHSYGLYIADQVNSFSTVIPVAIYVAGGNSVFNDPVVISGGLAQTIKNITAAYYVTSKDSTINANGTFTVTLPPSTLVLTSVAPLTGTFTLTGVTVVNNGSATYTGTITGGGSNAFVGRAYQVKTFINSGNNGIFVCTASTATTLVLSNAAAVVEAVSATATTYCALYQGTITGGASNAYAGAIFTIQGFVNFGNNSNEPTQFRCLASTATSLTLVNANAVSETHAATALAIIPVGQQIRITNTGSGIITVSSTANINGATTLINSTQYSSSVLQWDGTQWWTPVAAVNGLSGAGAFFLGPGITDLSVIYGSTAGGQVAVNRANGALTANQVSVYLFELLVPFTITKCSTECSDSVGGVTTTFGIYSQAGNLLVNGGAFTALNGSGVQTNTFTAVTLPAGTYWFAQASTTATAVHYFGQLVAAASDTNGMVDALLKNATRVAIAANALSAGALPATLGVLTPFTPTSTNVDGFAMPIWE